MDVAGGMRRDSWTSIAWIVAEGLLAHGSDEALGRERQNRRRNANEAVIDRPEPRTRHQR